MKTEILKVLEENTQMVHHYQGGGIDPIIIAFRNDECETWSDGEKTRVLSYIADQIEKPLLKEREELIEALKKAIQYAIAWQVKDIQPLLGEDLDEDINSMNELLNRLGRV